MSHVDGDASANTPENAPVYRSPNLDLVGDEHIHRYEETDGAVGHEWNGAPCLVLTTTGRRTGKPRKSALIYGQHGEDYVVVASKGGSTAHPSWYLNLVAEPRVHVRVLGDLFEAVAATASGDQRTELWQIMTDVWPNYDVYTTRTSRVIPVVVLRRQPEGEHR
jgi:deazaflavin-dependent oxidoreductase (nitroreductase family)